MKRLVFAALLGLFSSGCSRNGLLDFAMRTTPRPPPGPAMRVGPYQVLAGDMHTHVLPPDSPSHVSRDFAETALLAKREGLDFVVLTPHVPSRFFMRPDKREWVRETQRTLRAQIAAHPSDVIFVPGMEYTDHRYGHVGLAFASLEDVLADVPLADAQARPSMFFERWAAHGGVMTINHPRLRGNPAAPIKALRYDMGWRALFDEPPPVPPEIAWLTEHAQTIETLNTSVAHLRDQFVMNDVDRSLRETTHLADRVARAQRRRFTGVGGSDSHGGWLRPTTWVLARDRSSGGIRDALTAGRTCVRGPEGCTLAARAPGGAWIHAGGSITTHGSRAIEVRAEGGVATYFVNGGVAAHAGSGETATIEAGGRCALVRAIVAESWSAPIYVDCAWANDSPAAPASSAGVTLAADPGPEVL